MKNESVKNIFNLSIRRLWMSALLILVAVSFNGCAKIPVNGSLDGQWQVMEVNNGKEVVTPPEGARYYYNFYLHVCQLGVEYGRPPKLAANMVYSDNTILLDFPYVKNGDVGVEWIDNLKYWGLPMSGEIKFDILKLDKSTLILRSGDVTVTCRRF